MFVNPASIEDMKNIFHFHEVLYVLRLWKMDMGGKMSCYRI